MNTQNNDSIVQGEVLLVQNGNTIPRITLYDFYNKCAQKLHDLNNQGYNISDYKLSFKYDPENNNIEVRQIFKQPLKKYIWQ